MAKNHTRPIVEIWEQAYLRDIVFGQPDHVSCAQAVANQADVETSNENDLASSTVMTASALSPSQLSLRSQSLTVGFKGLEINQKHIDSNAV